MLEDLQALRPVWQDGMLRLTVMMWRVFARASSSTRPSTTWPSGAMWTRRCASCRPFSTSRRTLMRCAPLLALLPCSAGTGMHQSCWQVGMLVDEACAAGRLRGSFWEAARVQGLFKRIAMLNLSLYFIQSGDFRLLLVSAMHKR